MLRSISFFVILAVVTAIAGGCRTGLFGRDDIPAAEPAAPPAPLVVDGVRTSYADVVEKTSPAVVRIEAESKSKRSEQQPQINPFGDDDFFRMPSPRQQQPRMNVDSARA
jgi:S1-C subfamily serine protease